MHKGAITINVNGQIRDMDKNLIVNKIISKMDDSMVNASNSLLEQGFCKGNLFGI